MFLTPWLTLTAPVVDLADPPPRPTPPQPAGASRIEVGAGIGLVDDIGWELDLGLVGAGYVVIWKDESVTTSHTLWTRLQATHYMPADSEMMMDRFWIGPLIRGSVGTEIIGRYGTQPGSLVRYDFSVGLRGNVQPGISAAFGLGWAVIHDIHQSEVHHGCQLWGEVMFR